MLSLPQSGNCVSFVSGLLKQHGELRPRRRRLESCENVWWNIRHHCWSPTDRRVFCTGQRCRRGPVLYPLVRSRLRAAVSAIFVSGHEHAPETHCPPAHLPEQEEDRYTGGAGSRSAQVLPEVITPDTPFVFYLTKLLELASDMLAISNSMQG